MRRINEVQEKLLDYRAEYEQMVENMKVASTGESIGLTAEMHLLHRIISELSDIAFSRNIMFNIEDR